MASSNEYEVEATISATVSDNETPATNTLPYTSDDSEQHRASGEVIVETFVAQRVEVKGAEFRNENRLSESASENTEMESPIICDRQTKSPPLPFLRMRSFKREDSTSDKSEPRTPEKSDDKENVEKESKARPLSFIKVPKLKREKSNPETLERKKKRVKFSPNDDDDNVIVDTHVFEPQAVSCFRVTEDNPDGEVSSKIKKLLKRRSRKKKSTIETQTEDDKRKEIQENEKCTSEERDNFINIPLTSVNDDKTTDKDVICLHDMSSPEEDHNVITASASDDLTPVTEQHSLGTNNISLEAGTLAEMPCPVQKTCDSRLSQHYDFLHNDITDNNVNKVDNVFGSTEKAQLQEEQELEISSCKEIEEQDPVMAEKSISASFDDEVGPVTSPGTIKREGTFTLDGPPPAKITKSSCDVTNDSAIVQGNTPPRDSIMEPLQFFINVNVDETLDVQDKTGKDTKPENVPQKKCVRIVEPDLHKEEPISPVHSLKKTAKKTFACAWRTALKSPDISDKNLKPLQKASGNRPKTPPRAPSASPRSSPTKPDTLQRSSPTKQESFNRNSITKDKSTKANLQRKSSDPKVRNSNSEKSGDAKNSTESTRLSRSTKKNTYKPDSPRVSSERTSVWSGVSLTSFKRDGTFTKKYDSERDRLQAECHKLNVEKDRLQSELTEARNRLDDEVASRKALKRNNELSLRQLREGELKRTEMLMADLRNRLEDEKREALLSQRDSILRNHESELVKVDRERVEDHRKILCEARLTEERLKAEIKRETQRVEHQQPAKQCCHASEREVERLNRDLITLREYKKRLEEAVQLDELRSKERTITHLEKQVSAQSAKIRLQEEKVRELSNDRSEELRKQTTRGGGSSVSSKKHKDGSKMREKESSSGSISTASNTSNNTNTPTNNNNNIIILPPTTFLSTPTPPIMEQSVESGISMVSENEDLRQQLDNAKQEAEQAEKLQQKHQQELELAKQEAEQAQQKYQQELELLQQKFSDQQQEIEDNLIKIANQKEIIDEQQARIVDLTEEAMDRECMVMSSQPHWPPKIIESCVKVCDLPTVIEQSSDEELSPISSPTTPDPSPLHTFGHHDSYEDELDCAHTPTAFLTPTTPGTEPLMWPQVQESKFGSQLSRVSDEWQNLLASTSTATSPSIDLNKDCQNEWWSSARVMELENETSRLQADLQEARDHADLLEFRVLELTEGASDRVSECGVCVQTKDQSTSTDFDDVTIAHTNEDLSLPLSIDSGLDISNDYKARVTEGRHWLAQLSEKDPTSQAAQHLSALLDWLATIPAHSTHHGLSSPMSPTLTTPAPTPKTGMGGDDLEGCEDIGRDLMVLATRLQESLNDPSAQEPLLLDTIAKLRVLDASLSQLQERVVTLTEENRELQEAVTTLSDAHETRTEASGTESELVHRKTPSIHSDLSDAESDSPEHAQQHRPVKLVTLDASTSFQESGIFDTSCELVHVTTQTELESDEYLRTCLDERVVISKLEYDGIVESERCLQRELEHTKCEKDQIRTDCENLKEQIRAYKASCGTDAEEALKGEIRVLKQNLLVSERSRQEVFEEKCELEEEENDSRLMVQRLESQMEAAREMENLLSASLSQEQEISRELHRRVRELQILEKDHRVRLERLECVSQEAEQKAADLAAARDQLAMQLTFATYGLMLVDNWRLMVPNPNDALIPYTGKTIINVAPEICHNNAPPILSTETASNQESRAAVTECDKCMSTPVMSDVCVQTYYEFPVVSEGVQTDESLNEAHRGLERRNSFDQGQRRSAERNADEPLNKRPRSTKSQSTMTQTSETPTDLEQYYLEQIEALQREKINLRKGHETDRRDSLKYHSNLEEEMEEVRQELQVAKEDRCALVFRLEESHDDQDVMKQKFLHRIEELKGDMSRYKEAYEHEKKSLQRDFDVRVKEVENERDHQEERVHQLEMKLSKFRQELEIIGVSNSGDMAELNDDTHHSHNSDDGELIVKIRELVKSETALRQKIHDLEKKECAYRETIREADAIMSSHVTSYRQRIEELEATIDQQLSKIQQLESSEDRLRSSLRNNSRTSEGARISDLLDRLIETENSELKLKERVWTLERSEKELQIKLMEGEKNNQSLRGELRDQEELVHRLRALETENNALSVELNQAQDSARKVSEIQQSEIYLRGRVEELEVTENMLRETLHQADLILAQRERKLRDQISSLQEDVQAYKAQLEAAASKEYGARESEVSYRRQLEELKSRLADTERELKESSSETMSHETQHRSEVTKLRNQLKLSNSQLTELDRLNCELRDRVLAAEGEGQRLSKELEEHGRRHEQDLITFNLQISSRDSRIEEMEHQIEQMSQAHAASELDALASSPIASLHTSITALTTALKNCDSCKETQSGTLTEVSTQLGTLAELLEGQSNSDIDDIVSDTDEEETHDAENLAHETTSTPPPNPAGEGPREQSSGDVVNCATGGRLKRDTRRRSRRRLEERSSRRLVRPQGSTTILEELEEKVRELEEAVARKEDEIILADNENCELNNQVQTREAAFQQKSAEVDYLNSTLASLRQQLMLTMEDYERSKLSLQAKHKVDVEQLTQRVDQLAKEAERLACQGKLKDSIIATLAGQIRAILRSGNMSVVINQLRRLQDVSHDQDVSNEEESSSTDFDVEAVCSLLSQPNEDMK